MIPFKFTVSIFETQDRYERLTGYGWAIAFFESGEHLYPTTEYVNRTREPLPTKIAAWESALSFIELLKAEDEFLPAAPMQTMGYKPPSRPPAERTEGMGTR